jgi:hypothetical protein
MRLIAFRRLAAMAGVLIMVGCRSAPPTPSFTADAGIYQYAPSIIQDEPGSRYILYCTNTTPYVVRDSIGLRKARRVGTAWLWGEETIALHPEGEGWDSVHVCDPDMVRGTFIGAGETWSWMMVYLGCDTLDNTHNQVGLAFARSPEGPWHRFSANPVVAYPSYDRWWGAGQPSVVSLDRRGIVRLFYTRGDAGGTRMMMRDMDLTRLDAPVIGPEIPLSTHGLTEADAAAVVLHGGALALTESGGTWWLLRDRHPFPASTPSFIAGEEQIAWSPAEALAVGESWTVAGVVGPALTGAPRNHNGTIVKDAWGRIPDSGPLSVACSVAAAGPGFLWTYRIVEVSVPRAR